MEIDYTWVCIIAFVKKMFKKKPAVVLFFKRIHFVFYYPRSPVLRNYCNDNTNR